MEILYVKNSFLYPNDYWVILDEVHRYHIHFGNTFVEIYNTPYANMLLSKKIGTFRIKKQNH